MDLGSRQMFQDGRVSARCIEFDGPFAGKPRSYRVLGWPHILWQHQSTVGVSLLAMADYQATKITRRG
ncbi:hypothetical protein FBY12_3396 [Pseudomonas sp. SJZ131]|nr:hypothetical protein FBY12_3396 [Pseudomonas sp. SJZ131]